jgi:hypothetical protein
MADLSQLSDEDLKKLYADDYKGVSKEGLETLKTQQAEAAQTTASTPAPATAPVEAQPSAGPVKPEGFYNQYIEPVVTNVVGGAQTAYPYVKKGAELVAEHPVLAAYGASYIPGLNRLPGISTIKQGREAAESLLKRVNPVAPSGPAGSPANPIGGVPGTAPGPAPVNQPSMWQRGMDVASRMRQAAASRVLPAVAPVAVPAAVGAGGAALSNMAAQQLANMTPEQRRQLYENPMLGAMSGDAGFAAAIMNANQR